MSNLKPQQLETEEDVDAGKQRPNSQPAEGGATAVAPTPAPAAGAEKQATPADVCKALQASPNGLTLAELGAKLGLVSTASLEECVTQLQEDCAVYLSGEHFRLL